MKGNYQDTRDRRGIREEDIPKRRRDDRSLSRERDIRRLRESNASPSDYRRDDRYGRDRR